MTERSARVIFLPVGSDPSMVGLLRSSRLLEEESVDVFASCFVALAAPDVVDLSCAVFSAHAFLLAADFSARVSFLDGTDINVPVIRGRVGFACHKSFLGDDRPTFFRDDDPFFLLGDLLEDFDDPPILKMSKKPIANLPVQYVLIKLIAADWFHGKERWLPIPYLVNGRLVANRQGYL